MAQHFKQSHDGNRQRVHATNLLFSLFVGLVLTGLSIPLAGMTFSQTSSVAENRELATMPVFFDDGVPNWDYLAQLGAYFEDHFALKGDLIEIDARAKARLFGCSATKRVILGSEGWLYYQGTLDDYQRTNGMSARAISNAVHNMSLMQEYVQSQGCSFVLTMAPDKNALYPEQMPYFLPRGEGWTNLDRMRPLMEAAGINYLDLHEILGADNRVLYLKTDSHWSNEGARIAYDALLSKLGREHDSFATSPTTTMSSVGDLASMLYPLSATPEEQILYEDSLRFVFRGDANDVEASTIETSSSVPEAQGSLLCFRDSFGNALLPYLATAYERAYFSKMIPYDLGLLAYVRAEDVIVERTERHASTFATNPPYMPSPQRQINLTDTVLSLGHASVSQLINGPYIQVGGSIDEDYFPEGSRVYVTLERDGDMQAFECFLVSAERDQVMDVEAFDTMGSDDVKGDFGYRAFLPRDILGSETNDYTLGVVVVSADGSVQLAQLPFEPKGA